MQTFIQKLLTVALLLCLTSCASNQAVNSNTATINKMQKALDEAVKTNDQNSMTTAEAVNDALIPPLKIALPASSQEKLNPRFDLVINDAPAVQVLMGIVSGTQYSLLPKNIEGSISLNLKNVTLFEALDSIRELYGYEYSVEGNRIFIEPETIQTRIFQVNYIVGKRGGTSETRVTSGSMTANGQQGGANGNNGTDQNANANNFNNGGGNANAGQVVSSSINTSSDTDFWKDLGDSINGLVGSSEGRKVVMNTQSGLIMVRAMPKEIRDVENFLRIMQVNIERQVILEAKILNVELNDSFQSGVNWSIFGKNGSVNSTVASINANTNLSSTGGAVSTDGISGNVGQTIATTALGGPVFALALQGSNFATLLSFLETQGNVQVLSSPRIATINNQKAVLKVGTDDFFVTNISQNVIASVGATTSQPNVQLQPFFSGIALDVTPQIDRDDNIILHMHPSISKVVENNKIINLGTNGSLTLPLASNSVSETDSIVRTRDGNVIAIGGLMTESSDNTTASVPGISKVKGIGEAFKQRNRSSNKTELVILLKATVVRGQETWNKDMLSSKRRFDRFEQTTQASSN